MNDLIKRLHESSHLCTGLAGCVHCEAINEIERLHTELVEWKTSALRLKEAVEHIERERDTLRNKLNADSQVFELECRKAQVELLERERDEAHALLREATSATACAVCGADLLPTLDIPHCEDCVVDEDAEATYAEAAESFTARLAAVLGGEA